MNAIAKKLFQYYLKKDPEVDYRVKQGIENHRKGFGYIELVDRKGKPVKKAKVKLTQKKHEYHFGCNLFLLDQFEKAEENEAYKKIFRDTFNLAVVPFYWSDLEPQDGALRFEKNSPPIYRRPPPDLCLEYCEKYGITPKGHPLLWHLWWPSWLKGKNKIEIEDRIARRFREISERYADRIKIWDVVNEAQTARGIHPLPTAPVLPDSHVDYGFELAERMFPGSVLVYNDDRKWCDLQGNYSPVYLLVRHLLNRGLKVRNLGLQYHMFNQVYEHPEEWMNPRHLLACWDLYAKLGLPLVLSEISVGASMEFGKEREELQALVVERLYKIFFSHPASNGLVWWNFVDNTAALGEDKLLAGLLRRDMSPKKAYDVLKNLIKKEWVSRVAVNYEEGAPNEFHIFYGDYDVEIETSSGTTKTQISFTKEGIRTFSLKENIG